MKTFREKWLEAVEKKNSVLCAGLDPADPRMGKDDEGLPLTSLQEIITITKSINEGSCKQKQDWAFNYLNAVAPYCAAVKFNTQFWKGIGDAETLDLISTFAESLGLVAIEDSKLADIGSTNDAGFYYASKRASA